MMNTLTRFAVAIAVLIAGAVAFSQASLAQQVPTAVILVIDFQRVTQESLVGKDVAAQMESNRVELENRVRQLEEELRTQEEEIVKQKSIISPDAYEQRVRDFQVKAQTARQELQQKQQARQRAVQQANVEIQRSLRPIVRSIMEGRGATMVLDKNFVADHISGLDVTTEVIEQLDQAMPSFQVSLSN